jgi:prophage maintenance system killer protein
MIIFLKSNALEIDCTNKELAELGLGLADALYDAGYIREWIKDHIH